MRAVIAYGLILLGLWCEPAAAQTANPSPVPPAVPAPTAQPTQPPAAAQPTQPPAVAQPTQPPAAAAPTQPAPAAPPPNPPQGVPAPPAPQPVASSGTTMPPGAPLAAPSTTITDPGFTKLPFDLASRSFDRVLPFDVPFQITGTAPPGLARIELQYVSSKKSIVATKAVQACGPAQLKAITTEGGTEQELTFAPVPSVSWSYSPLLDKGTDPKYLLTIPALDPLRYYLFKFKLESRLIPQQATALQGLARDLFDRAFAQLLPNTDLNTAQAGQLHAGLVDGVKTLLAADHVIAPGTIFDPCLPAAQVLDAFVTLQRPISQAQNDADNQLRNLNAFRRTLESQLGILENDRSLQDLLTRLQQTAVSNAELSQFLQINAAKFNTLRITSVKADLLGPKPPDEGSPAVRLLAVNVPALVATYDNSQTRLAEAAEWLRKIANPDQSSPALVATLATVVTDADRVTIRTLTAPAPGGQLARSAAQFAALQRTAGGIRQIIANRNQALDALSAQVREQASEQVLVNATTTGNANTFQRYYISADLGLLYSDEISKLVPYAGTNIYLSPVNTNVPLSQKGGFRRRFSFTVGYTLQSIAESDDHTRDDFASGGSLVAGAGYRMTESIRLALGALVFYKEDTNPLVDDDRLAATPYLSVSFDINVAKMLAGIGQRFFANQ